MRSDTIHCSVCHGEMMPLGTLGNMAHYRCRQCGDERGFLAPPESYPVKPPLSIIGKDGNALAILGEARKAARKAGWTTEEWNQVRDEATSGDYNHLLATLCDNFDVE